MRGRRLGPDMVGAGASQPAPRLTLSKYFPGCARSPLYNGRVPVITQGRPHTGPSTWHQMYLVASPPRRSQVAETASRRSLPSC